MIKVIFIVVFLILAQSCSFEQNDSILNNLRIDIHNEKIDIFSDKQKMYSSILKNFNYNTIDNYPILYKQLNDSSTYVGDLCQMIKAVEQSTEVKNKLENNNLASVLNDIISTFNLTIKDSDFIMSLICTNGFLARGSDSVIVVHGEEINNQISLVTNEFIRTITGLVSNEVVMGQYKCLFTYQLKSLYVAKYEMLRHKNTWAFVSYPFFQNIQIYLCNYEQNGNKIKINRLDLINPSLMIKSSIFKI